MATIYSSNYQSAHVSVPAGKYGIGEQNGRVRNLFGVLTLAADATSGDIAKMFKLPKGARVLDYKVSSPDLGGTGVMDFGWAVSDDAVEAADADGFIVDQDVSGQASLGIPAAGVPGLHKKFAAEVDCQLLMPTTSGATGATIEVQLSYVIE